MRHYLGVILPVICAWLPAAVESTFDCSLKALNYETSGDVITASSGPVEGMKITFSETSATINSATAASAPWLATTSTLTASISDLTSSSNTFCLLPVDCKPTAVTAAPAVAAANATAAPATAAVTPQKPRIMLLVDKSSPTAASIVSADGCNTCSSSCLIVMRIGVNHPHSVFFWIFLALLGAAIIYLVGGVLYKRIVLNAHGIEQLPNYATWITLYRNIQSAVGVERSSGASTRTYSRADGHGLSERLDDSGAADHVPMAGQITRPTLTGGGGGGGASDTDDDKLLPV